MSSARTRTTVALAAIITTGVLALAGCATPSEGGTSASASAEPTASATPIASPTSTPTPTAEPSETAPTQTAPADDPATWVISGAGVGPLVLGSDFASLSAALGSAGWTAGCGSDAPSPGAAVLSYSGADQLSIFAATGYAASGDPNTALSQVSITGTADSSPRTAEGIGIGSTVAEVQSAFPEAQNTMLANYSMAYRVPAPGGTMYFGSGDGSTISGISVTTLERPMSEFCG